MKAKMLQIELGSSEKWAAEEDWPELARKAALAALEVSSYGELAHQKFALEISIKLSDNDEVQGLNRSYRGKDKPTNVLSFPQVQHDLLQSLTNSDDGEVLLGDIILAHGVCTAEADKKKISIRNHVTHLLVHGTLHLLGYDHEDEHDAIIMEDLETSALANLGIADPYYIIEE